MPQRLIELTISYNGKYFYGFYSIYGVRTVQGELEKALERILGEKITIQAEPGLVAGMNVKCMLVYFFTHSGTALEKIMEGLNHHIAEGLVIGSIQELNPECKIHKQKTVKEYEYYLFRSPIPTVPQNYNAYPVPENLNIDAMQEALALLIGENDFSSFTTQKYEDPYRTILAAFISQFESQIMIHISATDFLMNMVQMLVGELIRIGLEEIEPCEIKTRLAARKPDPKAPEMPSWALFLARVTPIMYFEDIIHNYNDDYEYYIIQKRLKTDGNVFIIILRCADELFEQLLSHIVRTAYIDANRVYAIDVVSGRIRSKERIGSFVPRIAMGVNFAEIVSEFELRGTWYLMKRDGRQA